jgi:mxaA protein
MSRNFLRRWAWAACLLWLCPALAVELPPGILRMDLEATRPYGYVIGDLIELNLDVQVASGVTLDTSQLPEAGPVNRWLHLRQVAVQGESPHYRLQLQYQTFYAPLEVKNLTVPGLALQFKGPGGPVSARTPAWPFTMAPIRELSVQRSEGLEPMRPDAWPRAPEAGDYRWHFLAATLLALLALLGLGGIGYLRGWLGLGSRGRFFASALKALRPLPDGSADQATLRQAYAAVHEAFNRTLGETLFQQDLDRFIEMRPRYGDLRSEIEAFFDSSYRLFFADGEGEMLTVSRLKTLCRACLQLERMSG